MLKVTLPFCGVITVRLCQLCFLQRAKALRDDFAAAFQRVGLLAALDESGEVCGEASRPLCGYCELERLRASNGINAALKS